MPEVNLCGSTLCEVTWKSYTIKELLKLGLVINLSRYLNQDMKKK
ncbi:MAG: hypothetical protein AB8U25_00870 [Rickettsiales endosymbiont of Dermacentor nuttalli]